MKSPLNGLHETVQILILGAIEAKKYGFPPSHIFLLKPSLSVHQRMLPKLPPGIALIIAGIAPPPFYAFQAMVDMERFNLQGVTQPVLILGKSPYKDQNGKKSVLILGKTPYKDQNEEEKIEE